MGFAWVGGAIFPQARLDKARKYPELIAANERVEFLVLGAEVGGRFSPECVDLVQQLISFRAQQEAFLLRGSFSVAFFRRWWGILSIACQRAVAQCCVGFSNGIFSESFVNFEDLCCILTSPLVSKLPACLGY